MFDWLTDGIVSYIIDVFTSLVANIESLSILAQKTPSQFNPEIWQTITTFNKTAVLSERIGSDAHGSDCHCQNGDR